MEIGLESIVAQLNISYKNRPRTDFIYITESSSSVATNAM